MTAPVKAHRHGDSRACGATTTVLQQSSVYVNNRLWAIDGETDSHGDGQISAVAKSVYVRSKLVTRVGNHAAPDDLCFVVGGAHCDPYTTTGSPDVYVGDS